MGFTYVQPNLRYWLGMKDRVSCRHQQRLEIMTTRLRIESFLKMARECHGDRYDYSSIHHVYARKKVSILCPTHGVFEQAPAKHLAGQGCPQCAAERRGNSSRHTLHDFIARARAIHNTRYDYSQVEYKNNHPPVTIVCPKHGTFQHRTLVTIRTRPILKDVPPAGGEQNGQQIAF